MGQGKADEAEGIKEQVRVVGEQIAELDIASDTAGDRQTQLLMSIPNLPHVDCPVGSALKTAPV